jgi:hypothetical protein
MSMRVMKFCSMVAICISAAVSAQAVQLQTQTPQGSYAENIYGGSRWATFTGMIDAAFSTVTQTASFDAIGAVDAVLVDQELGGVLSGTEIASIQAFVAGGKKAVLFGENDSWAGWNASVMSVVGGSHTDTCSNAIGAPTSGSSLVAGVGSVRNGCGSVITGGGEILFDNGMAALFSIGLGEALVILDSNWNDDTLYLNSEDNAVFAQNVVDWLATPITPVPAPAGLPLIIAALGALGLAGRRRR